MSPAASTFPPRPIRDVRAVYARQTSCPSDFADAIVDFEPWEEGVAFEMDPHLAPHGHVTPEDLSAYCAALDTGIRQELAELDPGTTVAVAVVLRRVRVHEVDSHPGAFQKAGRLAVRAALTLSYGPPPKPKHRRA